MFLEGQSVNISSASVLTIKLCCDNFKGTNNVKGKRTCGRGKDQSRDSFVSLLLTHQLIWESLKLLERID